MGIFDKLLEKGGNEKDKPSIRKLKKNRDIDGLNKALEHSNKGVRRDAAQALAYLAKFSGVASESSIKPLEKVLIDDYWFARTYAALALGWLAEAGIASESRIEPLKRALSDSHNQVRKDAAEVLSSLAESGVRKKHRINKEEISKVKIMTTKDAVRFMEEELNIKMVIVPKEDILRKKFVDVEPILFYITEKIKETQKFPVLMRILVDGYNEDPRLLLEIPEVIEWFGDLHSKYSYLPYFLDEETIPLYYYIVAIYKDKRGITPTKDVIKELGEFFGETWTENDFQGSKIIKERERENSSCQKYCQSSYYNGNL